MRYLLRLVVAVLLLFLLCAILIQIPAVQQKLTSKLENYLQNRLHTEVQIQSIRIKFLESLALEGVYIEDLQRDTLLNVNELVVNFKLNKFFSKQVQFDKISLIGGNVNLHTKPDSTSNFDFVLQAFSSPVDTPPPAPTAADSSSKSWEMTFDDAALALRDIDFQMKNELAGPSIAARLGQLDSSIERLDYESHQYQLDRFYLKDTQLRMEMNEETEAAPASAPESPTEAFALAINADQMVFEQVAFELDMPDQDLFVQVDKLENSDFAFKLEGDDLSVKFPEGQIVDGTFKFKDRTSKSIEGFDPQQLDFQKINTTIRDFEYNSPDIHANILACSAIDAKGMEIKTLQTIFDFTNEAIHFKDLSLQTPQTTIESVKTSLLFPLQSDTTTTASPLGIESDLKAKATNLEDLLYFLPELGQIPFFQNQTNQRWNIDADINGSLQNLNISALDFKGFNTALRLDGTIKNLTQPDLLDLDLQTFQLTANDLDVRSLVPPNTFPEYVQLPDSFDMNGTIKGQLSNFISAINVQTRRASSPFPTQINAHANIQNLLNPDKIYLDIKVDSLHTSRSDLLAYLPPDVLPSSIQLPDAMHLKGTVKGFIDDLESDFQLATFLNEESNQFKAIGSINGLLTSESPNFNLELDASTISQEAIRSFLPDSLLPAYLRLPFIEKLTGAFKGDFTQFETDFQLASNTGKWTVAATLEKEAYQLRVNVADMKAESFFTENYLDSMAGVSFTPWSVELQLDGDGFDGSESSYANVLLKVRNAADTSKSGLKVEGKLDKQLFTGKIHIDEKEIQLNSALSIDITEALPEWTIDLELEELDLEQLNLSELPFGIDGHLKGKGKGYDLTKLSTECLASDIGIYFADQKEQIDSLLLKADFDQEAKSLNIHSDWLDAQLKGQFQHQQVIETLRQQFNNLSNPNELNTEIATNDDHFDWKLHLHRPEILTMGFIPGLKELTPFRLSGAYDNREGQLTIESNSLSFNWQDYEVEDLLFGAKTSHESFNYQLQFQKAKLSTMAELLNGRAGGRMKDHQLQNNIQLLDEEGEKRYEMKSSLRFNPDGGLSLSLFPKQLLNYQQWEVSEKNEINWLDKKLSINDWRFFKESSAIEIQQIAEDKFALQFDQFNLKTLSDIVKLNSGYLEGQLNGTFSVEDLFNQIRFSSDLKIDSLVVLEALLGDLSIDAQNKGGSIIHSKVLLQGNENDVKLEGDYDWKKTDQALNFQLQVPNFSLQPLEPIASDFIENISGMLKGGLQITGAINKPLLTGEVHFEDAGFDVESLNTRLRFGNQPIAFSANSIDFKDLEVFDANNQKGIISSRLVTENFINYALRSELGIKDFLVLNTTKEDNNLYFGKLLIDAKASLSGSIMEPTIEIITEPKKSSDMTYVYGLNSFEVESHEGIVEFVSPNEVEDKDVVKQLIPIADGLKLKTIVKAKVSEKLSFKIITDPITGDYFKGKAKGDLVYIQKPDGTMELNGSLEVVEGNYLFTYQELVRRPFEVKPGGTISWTGDPFNPELNINVAYKTRTSIYPLIAGQDNSDDSGARTTQKQTFAVNLNISGTPAKTKIATSIEYPRTDGNSSNSQVQAAIDRINQDPSLQNTQAFSMILFNGFTTQNIDNMDFQVFNLSGRLNNVITQQLNGLANQYIKFVELDFDMDTYDNDDANSQTDFTVSVRKRFLNDRLTVSLDGKTSTERGSDDSESQTFLDNVTVEYALTPDGRFKIKVYNKQDYDDFISRTSVKYGGALIFSKEFDRIKLVKRKKR